MPATPTKPALATLSFCALLCLAGNGQAVNFDFLDQGPIRYFNAEDMRQMSATIDAVLTAPASDAPRTWRNDNTGSHGSVRLVTSFEKHGRPCRRIEVSNHARTADERSVVDMCDVDGVWKVLGLPK